MDDSRKSLETPLEEKSLSKSWKAAGKFIIEQLTGTYQHSDLLKAVVRNCL